MGIFLVHMIKAAVCLIVFYLFFRVLMNKETFHRFNRIAVLCILGLSLIIPFFNIELNKETQGNHVMVDLNQFFLEPKSIEVAMPAMPEVTWVHIMLVIYFLGVAFFTLRYLYFLIRIWKLLKQGQVQLLENGLKLVLHEKQIAPFSWMNYIVMSRGDMDENGREIMIHEVAHIHKCHSIDVLLMDVYVIFQWFNPAAWLIKQELQNIHEYEADEYVLDAGVDAKQYQLLLIKKAVGKRLYSMANSFNHSKLKKRITMMSKRKSSPWGRLKYLYVLPVTAIAITAFAYPKVSNSLTEISATKVSDLVEILKENNQVNDTIDRFVLTNIPIEGHKSESVDEEFKMTNIPLEKATGAVHEESVKPVTSAKVNPARGNSGRYYILANTSSGGYYIPCDTPVADANVIVKGAHMNVASDENGRSRLNVSGNAALEMGNLSLHADRISINLEKEQSSLNIGVQKKVSGIVKDSSGNPVVGAIIQILGTKIGVVADADGKFSLDVPEGATLAVSMFGMNSATVRVDKSNFFTIILTSQDSSSKLSTSKGSFNLARMIDSMEDKKPLVVVDGKVGMELKSVDPSDVDRIELITDNAVELYGEKAKNGVVIVTTKKK